MFMGKIEMNICNENELKVCVNQKNNIYMIIVMNVHTSYTCLFLNNNKQITRKDFVIGCNIRTWYIEFFDLACF